MVPSDLVELTAINYFKHRNRGVTSDVTLTNKLIKSYLPFFKRDPRKFFLYDWNEPKGEFSWTSEVTKFPYRYSFGWIGTSYTPISPIFEDKRFNPVNWIFLHKYSPWKTRLPFWKKKTTTALLSIHGYAETTFWYHEQSYFHIFKNVFDDCDIYTVELPYHFRRQPINSPFSGAYYLNGNPVRMLEAVRQSVQEILFITEILKEKYERVIIFGLSLGGHIAALASQFLKEVDLISALASPFLFALNPKIVPVSVDIVYQLKSVGKTNYYKILYPANLKYFSPFTTNLNTAFIGGRYDRIVPFERVKELSIMLGKPLYAYPGGHLTLMFWLRSMLKQINTIFTA